MCKSIARESMVADRRLGSRRSHPIGRTLPPHVDFNVATSFGTLRQRAAAEGVSTSTVWRSDQRVAKSGTWERGVGAVRGARKSLSPKQAALVFCLKAAQHTASIRDVKKVLQTVYKKSVSDSTVSREYSRLGMTRKRVRRYSSKRDEEDRVDYWCNSPDHQTRPGVCGVSSKEIVDIDETGWYTDSATRVYGHWLVGQPARQEGRSKRDGKRINVLAAVDINIGVIAMLPFEKGGTTSDKFAAWVVLFLLPAIADRRRVILMDNLTSHRIGADALVAAGHKVIWRPVHSPDFGPIELVFGYVETFLQAHDSSIMNGNFENAIVQAFDSVTPELVKSYFAHTYYAVAGRPFEPYMGQQ